MAKAIGRAVGRSVKVVPTPAWLFMKVARMSGYPIDLLSGVRYYIDDHKRGAFEVGAQRGVLDVTGRPAETSRRSRVVMRRCPQPTDFSNWLREFVQFMSPRAWLNLRLTRDCASSTSCRSSRTRSTVLAARARTARTREANC